MIVKHLAYLRLKYGYDAMNSTKKVLKHTVYLFLFQGISYLVRHNVLDDSCTEIGKFINCTSTLYGKSVSEFLDTR